MKNARIIVGLVCGLILAGIAAAYAQTGGLGALSTSPVTVGGFLQFNAGPQSSVIRATGGTFTANGSSAVTVTNSNVTATSVVVFGLKTVGGTIAGAPFMATVTPGTGFTVKAGGASDTSVYNYWILG
jgi:hypothetical protein